MFVDTNTNPGNFIALFKFFSVKDASLYEYLTTPMTRNATYKGAKSQNDCDWTQSNTRRYLCINS